MGVKNRLIAFVVGLLLLFTCAACSDDSNNDSAGQHSAVNSTSNQTTEIDYQELARSFATEALRNQLKNPKSLQVHSITIEPGYHEDDKSYYFAVMIDYSAQNGFGGYNRETCESYVQISKGNSNMSLIDRELYASKKAINDNLSTAAEYGTALDQIGGSVPLSVICSGKTYEEIVQNLKNAGKTYFPFTYEDGRIEVQYVDYFCDLECVVTFLCNAGNHTIYQINIYWNESQSFYDGKNAYTLSVGYQATLEEIDAIIKKIDTALDIEHGEIEEGKETYFTDYDCYWHLDQNTFINLSWTVADTSGLIGHMQLLACNEANQFI